MVVAFLLEVLIQTLCHTFDGFVLNTMTLSSVPT